MKDNLNNLIFLDTNIFIYAQDPRSAHKQKVAGKLVRDALANGRGVISSQVIQEFCNVALKKYEKVMSNSDIKDTLQVILGRLWRHIPSLDFYQRAIQLHTDNSLSFYDALIIQAAIDLGCATLYSEDLQDGQKFGKLTIVNPF